MWQRSLKKLGAYINGGMLSNHLTHVQWSLIICARSRIGRGGTMGTTGRSVFPFPIFPRAHPLRASLANILTHFLLEILPKNRLFKVVESFSGHYLVKKN